MQDITVSLLIFITQLQQLLTHSQSYFISIPTDLLPFHIVLKQISFRVELYSAETGNIRKFKNRNKLGDQLSWVFCLSSLTPGPDPFSRILFGAVLEMCPLGTVSPSSIPLPVSDVSHWAPVSFKWETTAGDLRVGGEIGIFIPPGVTTLLLPPMVLKWLCPL